MIFFFTQLPVEANKSFCSQTPYALLKVFYYRLVLQPVFPFIKFLILGFISNRFDIA